MATYHGVAINFGISSSLSAVTGIFQTRDHAIQSGNEIIANGVGDPVAKTYYGQYETATFEYVVTAAGGPAGNATPTLPTQGAVVTVTDAGYTAIAGTSWLVDKVTDKVSNTTALRVTCDLTRYGLITS